MKFQKGDTVRVVADTERLESISIYNQSFHGLRGKVILVSRYNPMSYYVRFTVGDYYFNKQDLELVEHKEVTTQPNTKETNPKDALGIKKAPLSTLPTGPMYEVALAMLEGGRKYGRHNYRVIGVKASVYYDAAMGHLTSWWEGEDVDPTSGLHHLAKAMACLAVVRDSMMMENWIDDRPPCYPDASKLMRNSPMVKTILEKYPDCVEPFTELNKNDRMAR